MLRAAALLGALADLLWRELEHHQTRPPRDGGRGVRLPVALALYIATRYRSLRSARSAPARAFAALQTRVIPESIIK